MLTIRNLRHSDIDSAIALQSRVYPSIPPFRRDQFENPRRQDRSRLPSGGFV